MVRVIFFLLFGLLIAAGCNAEPVTVLVPSQPVVENAPGKKKAKTTPEVDLLIALMDPYEYLSEDMDRPQFLAVLYYDPTRKDAEPQLINLLGDMEEIRYNGKKAWGVNVAVDRPGLYQFVLEAKPWWNPNKKAYLHQQAKVLLPVQSGADGWSATFGQSFEILPLTRPFGMVAPALFSARILLDGKAMANLPIFMGKLNTAQSKAANQWQTIMETRSNGDGQFSFLLNEPGWWYCEANTSGAPLKGPDGTMSEVERSTVLWVYVAGKSAK